MSKPQGLPQWRIFDVMDHLLFVYVEASFKISEVAKVPELKDVRLFYTNTGLVYKRDKHGRFMKVNYVKKPDSPFCKYMD